MTKKIPKLAIWFAVAIVFCLLLFLGITALWTKLKRLGNGEGEATSEYTASVLGIYLPKSAEKLREVKLHYYGGGWQSKLFYFSFIAPSEQTDTIISELKLQKVSPQPLSSTTEKVDALWWKEPDGFAWRDASFYVNDLEWKLWIFKNGDASTCSCFLRCHWSN